MYVSTYLCVYITIKRCSPTGTAHSTRASARAPRPTPTAWSTHGTASFWFIFFKPRVM